MDHYEITGKEPQEPGAAEVLVREMAQRKMQGAITCRCRFREIDASGECWARCGMRAASCEECGFGGRKFKPARRQKKYRKNGKIR